VSCLSRVQAAAPPAAPGRAPCAGADGRARRAQVCKPKDFAAQINLSMDNCWGIVRALVDLAMGMGDGKYLIVKDPNKPLLRLYRRAPLSSRASNRGPACLRRKTVRPVLHAQGSCAVWVMGGEKPCACGGRSSSLTWG
jgi:hypothetical protein